jgi:hypothetical protein
MAMMQPIININGSSRSSFVAERIAIVRSIESVMEVLCQTKPHGRDYPGNVERFATDTAIYQERFALLDKMRNEIHDEALAIHKGGN